MKKYLLILLITLVACQKQMLPLADVDKEAVAIKPNYTVEADLVKPVKTN